MNSIYFCLILDDIFILTNLLIYLWHYGCSIHTVHIILTNYASTFLEDDVVMALHRVARLQTVLGLLDILVRILMKWIKT